MKTIYLNLRTEGKPIKVIEQGLVPSNGVVFKVDGCKNRQDAVLTLQNYLQAEALGDDLEDLLDSDPETYTKLRRSLRRITPVDN